jgi:SAM-dependent methyltransferase
MSDELAGDHAPGHQHATSHQHAPGHQHGPGADAAGGGAAPPVLDEAFWEERYRSSDALWSGRPNSQLMAEIGPQAPGRALDAGCGEGADSVWLAHQGWQVTAVDISGTALERARAHAEDAGADVAERIEWVHDDVTTFDPGRRRFDLVSAQFVHLPGALRDTVHLRLAGAVDEGGVLLIVAHDPTDLATTVRRPPFPDFFARAADVAAVLPKGDWEVLVAEARPRPTVDGEGREVTVHDAVTVARRRVGVTAAG